MERQKIRRVIITTSDESRFKFYTEILSILHDYSFQFTQLRYDQFILNKESANYSEKDIALKAMSFSQNNDLMVLVESEGLAHRVIAVAHPSGQCKTIVHNYEEKDKTKKDGELQLKLVKTFLEYAHY